MNRHVGKRLVRYALGFKKSIFIALLLLTVAVTAELSGPFIAKRMIDVHILGIEYPWYEAEQGEDAVNYEGNGIKEAIISIVGKKKGTKYEFFKSAEIITS